MNIYSSRAQYYHHRKMIRVIKYIVITALVLYQIYKFSGFGYSKVSTSFIENELKTNPLAYKSVYIDEAKNTAYFHQNNKTVYTTPISTRENFKDTLKNITGNSYSSLDVYINPNTSLINLLHDCIVIIIAMNIIFSILKIFSFKKVDAKPSENDQDSSLFSIFSRDTGDFYTVLKDSTVKFSDIIGLDLVKEDLREFAKYLKYNKVYKENGCVAPHGILFTGPPGVGKTFMAKALACETEAKFIYTTASSFNEIYMGMGSKRVRKLFKYARENAPCIVFIDEIDAVGSRSVSESSSFGNSETNRTIGALLAELDGILENDRILVIGATNLDASLDPALTRSGRFDKKIVFDAPTISERTELFKLYLAKIKLDESFDMDCISTLASRTARLTGADIKNICNQAILNHTKRFIVKNGELVNESRYTGCTFEDLSEALDDLGIGNKKTNRPMTDKEKIQIAYHEAGHTLVSSLLDHGSVPLKVSMIPRGYSLGFTQQEMRDSNLLFKKELITHICVALAGRAAEFVKFDDVTSGANDDLQKVSDMVSKYFIDYGFGANLIVPNKKSYGNRYKSDVNYLIEELINDFFKKVVIILKANLDLLDAISNKLLEKETLNSQDLIKIIGKKISSVKIDSIN